VIKEKRSIFNWHVVVADDASQWAPSPEDLLVHAEKPDRVLRRDKRSIVLLLNNLPQSAAPPGPWVLKRPLDKDIRTFNRLTTLYRASEALQHFKAWTRLRRLGIPLPKPVMAFERRNWGMVSESWFLYRYEKGEALKSEHWPSLIKLLEKLHAAGLRHRDPHFKNWLQRDGEIIAIDLNPRRAILPSLAFATDFLYLRDKLPGIRTLLPKPPLLTGLIASTWHKWMHLFRKTKRSIRKLY